jgi:putative nucleotidyltransferase with HDIG domain
MITKKKPDISETLKNTLIKGIKDAKIRPVPAVVTAVAFLISAIVVINSTSARNAAGNLDEFEAGKVAERDVFAEKPVSYIDNAATRLLIEEQRLLVPAVFRYEPEIGLNAEKEYGRFTALCQHFFSTQEGGGPEDFNLAVDAEFPGLFPAETLDALFQDAERERLLENGGSLLKHLMEQGLFREAETSWYNPVMVEVLRRSGPRVGREQVAYDRITTMDTVRDEMARYMANGFSPVFKGIAFDLLKPFLKENVLFSPEDTDQRIAEAVSRVDPVYIHIEQGQRIIKKGFIIGEDDMLSIAALDMALARKDSGGTVGKIMLLLMVYGLFIFIGSVRSREHGLTDSEIYLLTALTSLYLIGAAFAKNLSFTGEFFPAAILLPTALVIMLPAILISSDLALAWAFVLPLAAFFTGSFDMSAYLIALVSGVVASYSLKNAERRMDLVKAGLIIAAANALAVIAVLLIQHAAARDYPVILFWAAFNGVASGMLVLGFLPPLEQGLNAATTFRLIELSDLNAPIIKRLFTIAPGTYSHSVMVAHLAEAACQEIGANSLLARVGAYYHDIGKMDQPDYFVENQSGYNKHDEIPPRLSATIIRSHVKLGVEKARSMKLPKQVIDIIAEHHGNSLIFWFYTKALEHEKEVSAEDFSYPGTPPRSRESAVVMLADVSEAAVRTIEKPTAAKIEKFIQGLIDKKVEHGQLAESELTFRDLGVIKKAFVKVLASYYHSRIEYPKEKKDTTPPPAVNS